MRLQRTPTGEQLRIITQTQGEFVVLASAGSGKTHVVNERYLHLITEVGVRPSEILTITFTKKAAAEMKRRIVGSLRDKGLFAEAQEAETGPIQTVHSFYERILRENSVRAGLDPNFEVMSQRDVQLLRRQIIRRAATLDEQDEPYIAEFLREMLGSHDQDDPSAYASFVKVVEDTMKRFRESGIPRSEFESIFSSPRGYKESTDRFLFLQLPQVIQDAIRESLDQDWVKVAKDALKPTDKLCDWLKPKFDVEKFEHDYRMTVALAQIAIRCWLRFESELRKLNVLDFESMENRAVRLLEGDLEVRERLKNLYPHIMVDEAQDNNPMQYRLLNALASESKMLIGDDKQSIYSFRNADVKEFQSRAKELVMRLTRNFRSDEGIQRAIDATFGSLMGEKYVSMLPVTGFDEPTNSSQYHGLEIVEISAKSRWEELGAYISHLQANGESLKDIAILVRFNSSVMQIKKKLQDMGIGIRTLSGASNLYARLEIRDIANLLAAVADPSDEFALLAMLRSPIVDLSLDSVILLSDRRVETKSLLSILKECLQIGMELPEAAEQAKLMRFLDWFGPLSVFADRLPAWEVLSQALKHSDLMSNLAPRRNGRQRIENVRKLLVLATRQPEYSSAEFAELIRSIDRLKQIESDAELYDDEDDLVSVSTIHSSKGLEWKTVIIADATDQKKDKIHQPLFDAKTGFLGYGSSVKSTPLFAYLHAEKDRANVEELSRFQYVAMTRAKKRLAIVDWQQGAKRGTEGLPKSIRNGIGAAIYDSLPTWSLVQMPKPSEGTDIESDPFV